ncbi:MAG: hypothetical protein M1831_003225 [Alyxoria varia]|nr:MAG: hypothetical protein M1831_003225 [Alyxoria varia]
MRVRHLPLGLFNGALISQSLLGAGLAAPPESDKSDDSSADPAGSVGVAENSSFEAAMSVPFADPSMMYVKDFRASSYYSFATRPLSNTGHHIQVAKSTDFATWEYQNNVVSGGPLDALPNLPPWVVPTAANDTEVWAPVVFQTLPNRFIMYFTAHSDRENKHCLGVATSRDPVGPYEPKNKPLLCQEDQGGVIDAAVYQDLSTRAWYMLYKVDGNALAHQGECNTQWPPFPSTPIMLQEMSLSGTWIRLGKKPIKLLDNNGQDDHGIVEAPSLVKAPDGPYFLFFSRGCYLTDQYTISYATSDKLEGPYERRGDLLKTGVYGGEQLFSPGGAEVHLDGDNLKIVFHAGLEPDRLMYAADATYDSAGKVQIQGSVSKVKAKLRN